MMRSVGSHRYSFFLYVRIVFTRIFQYFCRTIRSAGSSDFRLLEFYCTTFGCRTNSSVNFLTLQLPKFAGSNPAEAIGFFRAKKFLSTPSFGREVKPFVSCRRFTACKRSLNVTWKSDIIRQNSSAISRPSSFSFHY